MDAVLPGRNLVLIGFMGSGKSSVGRELAKRWNFRFADTDSIIRRRYELSIPDLFSKYGEPFFREAEYQTLVRLQGAQRVIIATGGGIVGQARNLPLLKALGKVVWLSASEATILQRVGSSTHRPMLNRENPKESISRLLSERTSLYRQVADLEIETSGLTHAAVAEKVIAGLGRIADSR